MKFVRKHAIREIECLTITGAISESCRSHTDAVAENAADVADNVTTLVGNLVTLMHRKGLLNAQNVIDLVGSSYQVVEE